MATYGDGPVAARFRAIRYDGMASLAGLRDCGLSEEMVAALEHAPTGDGAAWGIPFHAGSPVLVAEDAVTVEWADRVAGALPDDRCSANTPPTM